MKRRAVFLLGALMMSAACAWPAAIVAGQDTAVPKSKSPSPFEDVIKGVLETMDSLSKALATIHDEPSAKAAQDDLRKAADKWRLVQKKAASLPPPAKEEKDRLAKEYKAPLEKAQKRFFGEVARVRTIPGGRAALLQISALLEKKSKK